MRKELPSVNEPLQSQLSHFSFAYTSLGLLLIYCTLSSFGFSKYFLRSFGLSNYMIIATIIFFFYKGTLGFIKVRDNLDVKIYR